MKANLEDAARNTIAYLLSRRNDEGVWVGHLSSSALSTATAVIALRANGDADEFVARGRSWLEQNQNSDGGFGDTVSSVSNISTTALCWAALPDGRSAGKAEAWLSRAAGASTPEVLAKAIADRYGKDRTFSVPILTALTIGGRLGTDPWRRVPQLPFELAACPHQWFQWLKLPVVSYALPALIAIGLARHRSRPSLTPIARVLRNALTPRVMRILQAIQPTNGGFLEATPLTSFVAMSLIAAGLRDHPVVRSCLDFLRNSIRDDGSWPIDTNLSTWLMTLSINALADGGDLSELTGEEKQRLTDWLLAQQFADEHPYTHAAPGAWSWTNIPGAVPDADDTAGALLALKNLGVRSEGVLESARRGVRWLLDLQNRDGGMPTFCRGWGHLPFDRSGADLTAHTIRAWAAWLPDMESDGRVVRAAIENAVGYLKRVQRADGSWIPLWFGNQHAPLDENPTFGSARVLTALVDQTGASESAASGFRWLVGAQNEDGGWGGAKGVASSIEETSLAVTALAKRSDFETQCTRGLEWLANATSGGSSFPPSPIGFYFASLWYFEDLYPAIFAASAFQSVKRSSRGSSGSQDQAPS